MKDSFGREISYLRISITDRCNLRCRYCMPTVRRVLPEEDLLRYDEILRICVQAADLGITRFKITGGEPLMRLGASQFMAELKDMSGVEQVTLTTNGQLLERELHGLLKLDSINVSLDAVHEDVYRGIAGTNGAERAMSAIRACCATGMDTRINTVLLRENAGEWMPILSLAQQLPVSVRFIECMPIGYAQAFTPVPMADLLSAVRRRYPDLERDLGKGNGPAVYWRSRDLRGKLGTIAANTDAFCERCNRVRLTADGHLRGCLGHVAQVDLKHLLRTGASDAAVRRALEQAILSKPARHAFGGGNPVRFMNEIGG